MKKITFILLALCVAGAIVSGCSGDDAADETENSSDEGSEE